VAGFPEMLDQRVYEAINALAGRSALFDGLVDLALESSLVKAGVIGACFVFAWHQGSDEAAASRRRSVLMVTLVAALAVVGITKTLSHTVFEPRPYILSGKLAYLEGDRLVEAAPWHHRAALVGTAHNKAEGLSRGDLGEGDMGGFPSDHAGFYIAIALGIWLASRPAGLVALAWTLVVTLGSRVIAGHHSPSQIVAGAAIAVAVLLPLQWLAARFGRRLLDPIAGLSFRYPALTAAAVFLVAVEITGPLKGLTEIAQFGAAVIG
jgi:membrane-associated phospholipid phosphatase